MNKNLEELKERILAHLEKEGSNIFHGRDVAVGKPTTEIRWSSKEKDWKDFLRSAKLEEVKTIVFDYPILTDDDIEANLRDNEKAGEFNKELNSFRKFVGNIGEIYLMWIKDGVRYSYREANDWWLDFISLIAKPEVEFARAVPRMYDVTSIKISKDLKVKTAEELAAEFNEFIKKEFPDAESISFHELARLFWTKKGLRFGYADDPEVALKMRKAETLVRQKLEQEQLRKEKKLLPNLVKECANWARGNEFKKVTKTNVGVFLAEKGVSLSASNRDILYGRVNAILIKEEK